MRWLLLAIALFTFLSKADAAVFWQNVCEDASCSEGCVATEFPQGTCVMTTNGGSAENYCDVAKNELVQHIYPFQPNCTDYFTKQYTELGMCFSADVEYVEYACPASISGTANNKRHVQKEGDAVNVGLVAVDALPAIRSLPVLAQRRLEATVASLKEDLLHLAQHRSLPLLSSNATSISLQAQTIVIQWRLGEAATANAADELAAAVGDAGSWTLFAVQGEAPLNDSFKYTAKRAEQLILSPSFAVAVVDRTSVQLRIETTVLRSAFLTAPHGFAMLRTKEGKEVVSLIW